MKGKGVKKEEEKKMKPEIGVFKGQREEKEADDTTDSFKKGGHVKKYKHGGHVKGEKHKMHLGRRARGGANSPFTEAKNVKGGAATDMGKGDEKSLDSAVYKRGGKC